MNIVIRHIEYLISRKNCVIIPGIGAILAHDVPSKIDENSGIIYPPTRTYSFNGELSMSDGILIDSIAREQSISFDTATRRVEQVTQSILDSLRTSGSFIMGNMGELHYDGSTHALSFEASDSLISCSRTLWLQPVMLPEKMENSDQSSYDSNSGIRVEKNSFIKRTLRIAASIALLIGFCFIASTPLAVKEATLASLSPELRQLSPEEYQTPVADCPLTIVSRSSEIPLTLNNASVEESESEEYLVIVGTLRNMEEAEIFCNRFKTLNLHIHPRGKFVSVYTSSFSTRKEASDACKDAFSIFPDAWILKK